MATRTITAMFDSRAEPTSGAPAAKQASWREP